MTVARGTPFDDLFAALTEKMGLPHAATPDTDPSQRDRFEWNNVGGASVSRGYRRQGQNFCGFRSVKYDVSVYGATELEVIEHLASFEGWLDILVGPAQGAPDAGDGYDLGMAKPMHGGDGVAAGFATVLPLTLYLPVFQMVLGSGRVASSVNVNTTALNPDGTAPTGDPLNPVEAAA